MKVEQFINKNQFHMYGLVERWDKDYYTNLDILQSYNSKVVEIETDGQQKKITLGIDWDYSTTTSKHVYAFLEEYGNINFYGITNKKAYVNKLIKEGKINYDETMR